MATKVPKDLGSLSDEKLLELWDATAQEALDADQLNKSVAAEVHKRETVAEAQRKFESLNDVERAALASIMSPVGIESEEAVHNG